MSKADTLTIEQYKFRLNREMVIDQIEKKDRHNRAVIDSVINTSHSRYNNGYVTYSPDKRFKVFVLTGDDCGSHCSYINTAYIRLIQERKTFEAELYPVEHIYKLGDGKYLLLQNGLTSGGVYTSDARAAAVVSFEKGKLKFYPIVYKESAFDKSTVHHNNF